MKKIIFSIIVFLIVFLVYYFNINEKIYYVSIGDYLSYGINNKNMVDNSYSNNIKEYYKDNLDNYVNCSTKNDYRVMDLINDINNNKIITYNNKEYKFQNLLIKANLITISIGMNDIIYKKNISNNLTYIYLDELISDLNNLFKLIRKYNKDKIYFLGFYNIIENEKQINYLNKKIKEKCKENKIIYVDISDLNNYIDYLYPNNSGYKYITNQVLNFTKK